MYNKIILVGNLTRDVEIRYSSGGMAIATIGLASNRRFKSQTGEQRDETLFVDVTFFGRQAEVVNQYLRKGSKILVDGRLKFDQWTAPDGSKRSKHSVTGESMTMLDAKGSNPSDNYGGGYAQPASTPAPNSYGGEAPMPSPQQGYNPPPSQPSYNQPTTQNTPPPSPTSPSTSTNNIPTIDIDNDEIPF
jgi:single-strand DNA-binding protein